MAVGVALWLGLGRASGTSSRVPARAEIQQLRADALAFAKANGESAPTMEDAQIDSNQDVFVLRLHGNFVGYEASRPGGVEPPRGHYLEVVYDAQTKQLTDWNLSAQPQDLTRVGHAVSITP